MARHRPRRPKNDKLPYYIVGALVLIFLVVVFPKTGLFTKATLSVGQGSVTFECLSVEGSIDSCPKYSDDDNLQEGDIVTTQVKFSDIKGLAGIDFELKTNYDGEERIELGSAKLDKVCIAQYYECTSDSHCEQSCVDNKCVAPVPNTNPGTTDECFITNQNKIPDCARSGVAAAFTCPEINVANQNLDAGEDCSSRYYKSIMYFPSDSGIEVRDDDFAYIKDTVISESLVGYVISESEGLLKTTDGGETWDEVGLWTQRSKDLFVIDENTIFVVGTRNSINKWTPNGQSNTQTIVDDVVTTYNAVFFTNSNVGYVVGNNGVIIKTTDKGNTWTAQTSGTTEDLNDIYFRTEDEGMIVGDSGTALYTADGGSTWTTIENKNTDFTQNTADLFAVTYPQNAGGYRVVGAGGMYATTSIQGATLYVKGIDDISSDLYGISARGANIFAVGDYSYPEATILKSSDGGQSWTKLELNGDTLVSKPDTWSDAAALSIFRRGHFRDVFFLDDSTGYVVGENAVIIKTEDGGSTWGIQKGNRFSTSEDGSWPTGATSLQFIPSDYESECEALGGTYQSLGNCQVTTLSNINTNTQLGCELMKGTWITAQEVRSHCELLDDDNDGIYNAFDICPNSDESLARFSGEGVYDSGCSVWESGDTNNDGILNYEDYDHDEILNQDDSCPYRNIEGFDSYTGSGDSISEPDGCPDDIDEDGYIDNGEFEIINYRKLPMSNGVTDHSLNRGDAKCEGDTGFKNPFELTYHRNEDLEKTTISIQQKSTIIETYHIDELIAELKVVLIKQGNIKFTLDDFNIFDKSGDIKLNTFTSLESESTSTIDLKDTDGDEFPDVQEPQGSNLAGILFIEDETEWADSDGDGAGDNSDKCEETNCGLDESNCAANIPKTNKNYGCAENQIDDDGDGVLNMILDGEEEYMLVLDQCALTEWADSDGDGIHDTVDTFGCTPDATFKISQGAVIATDIRDNKAIFTDNDLLVDLSDATKTECTKTRTTTRDEWKDIKEDCTEFMLTLQFFDLNGNERGTVSQEATNYKTSPIRITLPTLEPGEYNLKISLINSEDNTNLASIPNKPVRIDMGDVNGDGFVSNADIIKLQLAIEGIEVCTDCDLDTNLDGVDASFGDLIKLKNIILER